MILVKTEAGQQVLRDRSVRLTPRQRSAFILFDGKRSVNQVLEAGMGIQQEDVDQLLALGLLGMEAGGASGDFAGGEVPRAGSPELEDGSVPIAAGSAPAADERSTQQRYKDAYPIATQLTASLGLRGFRLNLAVEGTSTYEELLALAAKIRVAVGPEKAAALDRALGI